jgi:small-conductance mechanosensitive channel
MNRILIAVILAVVLGGGAADAQPDLDASRARAAAPAGTNPQTATQAGAQHAAPASQVTAAQAQSALDVLTNDAKRSELVSTLETIVKAQAAPAPAAVPAAAGAKPAPVVPGAPASAGAPGTAPAAATPAAPAAPVLPLVPGSVGAELLTGASKSLSSLTSETAETFNTLLDVPLLTYWFTHLVTDPDSRASLVDVGWKLAVVLSAAIAVDFGSRRVLAGPARRLSRRAPEPGTDDSGAPAYAGDDNDPPPAPAAARAVPPSHPPRSSGGREDDSDPSRPARPKPSNWSLLRRLPYAGGRFLLDIAAILGAGVVGYLLLWAIIGDHASTRAAIQSILNAYIMWRCGLAFFRLLVAPDAPGLRLVHVSDHGAAYILRWIAWISGVAIFGVTVIEVGLLFGLYRIAHDALLRIVSLVVHTMIVIVILQTRGQVARRIRARPDRKGFVAALRNWLARTWHWVAIFVVVAIWVVWALELNNGMERLVRFSVVTVTILLAVRLLDIAIVGGIDRALASKDLASRHPSFQTRVRGYQPLLHLAVRAALTVAAGLALLEAWGFESIAWFTSGALGGRLLGAFGTVAITAVVSIVAWEVTNGAIENHLARLSRESLIARSARLRTLLPMLRTTIFVSLALFAGLTILSEIGVNIAPLLAGAGVVGLAIGFGSQKLVQDIITGLFLLLENAMQVGDVVSLAGLSGTVENLSIRTIRLRALDGAVHIVPFSAVTTVTNMTRDFGYALLDISIGLNEEADRISDMLRTLVSDMRREPRWAGALRDDLEVMGVEKFIDLAWVLRVRVKTLPGQRWAVGRELNRRIKYLFDEHAIESPFTSHRVLSGSPGSADADADPEPAPTPIPAPGQKAATAA